MPLELDYDFYAPFMSATILTEHQERLPLWMTNDPRGMSRAWLAELTVRFTLANIPIITAKLTPPYQDAITFLNSSLIEWGTSKLEVQFGYTAGSPSRAVLSPVFTGILLKPDIRLGESIEIVLNAQGISTFNITTQTGLRFLQGTRRDIVETFLRGPDPSNPRPLQLDDTEMQTAPPEVRAAWSTNVIEVQQGGISDWQWVQTLIWECHAVFYILGDRLKIIPRDTRSTQAPRRQFALFNYPNGKIGPRNGVFPILGANSPSMGIYLPGYLNGTVLRGVNQNTRQVEQRVVNDRTTPVGRTGRGGVNESSTPANPGPNPQGDGLEVMPGAPADQRVQEQVAAAQQDVAQRAGIRLELDTLGVPDLLPADTFSISGLGTRIDGPNYMVFDFTHTLGTQVYVTKLTAYANVSEAWTRAIPAQGAIPARNITDASRRPDAQRVEILSREEEQGLAETLRGL
jgi:hypothetical protein